MKTLTALSATLADTEIPARGINVSLHHPDPNCPGWFLEIALGAAGLQFKSRRGTGKLIIPLDDLVALARQHAPEIFADAKAIEESRITIAIANAASQGRATAAALPAPASPTPDSEQS